MATPVLVVSVGELSGGEVMVATKIVKGILKYDMKLTIDGKLVTISLIGTETIKPKAEPRGERMMRST